MEQQKKKLENFDSLVPCEIVEGFMQNLLEATKEFGEDIATVVGFDRDNAVDIIDNLAEDYVTKKYLDRLERYGEDLRAAAELSDIAWKRYCIIWKYRQGIEAI